MDEKRINPRFYCDKQREYIVDIARQKQSGRLMDLSRGGLSFESSGQHSQDEICNLGLKTDASENAVSCQVRIRWIRTTPKRDTCICGASIVQMDSPAKMDILDMLYQGWRQKVSRSH